MTDEVLTGGGPEWWDQVMGRPRTPLERAALTVDLADYTGGLDDLGKYPEGPEGMEWLVIDACRATEVYPDVDAIADAWVDCGFVADGVEGEGCPLARKLAERFVAALPANLGDVHAN
jgi:hypothetical protein